MVQLWAVPFGPMGVKRAAEGLAAMPVEDTWLLQPSLSGTGAINVWPVHAWPPGPCAVCAAVQDTTRREVPYKVHIKSTSSLQAGGEPPRQGLGVPLPMQYRNNADTRARTRQAPSLGATGPEVRPFSKFFSFFQRTRTSYTGNLGRAGCEHCRARLISTCEAPVFSIAV